MKDRIGTGERGWENTCSPSGVVATSITDLTDRNLTTAILCKENGRTFGIFAEDSVWTGTDPNGTSDPNTCKNWTAQGASNGRWGILNETDRDRTHVSHTSSCSGASIQFRIYCFEFTGPTPTTTSTPTSTATPTPTS